MLPEASSRAAARDVTGVSQLVSTNLTWAVALLAPASIVLLAASEPVVSILYGYGAVSSADVSFVASVTAAFGAGLLPFAVFQLLARAHYAFHHTRTPALVNVAAVVVNIAVDVVLFGVLEGRARVVGLAIGHAGSYLVAAAALWLVTARRLPGVHVRLDPSVLSGTGIRAAFTGRVPTAAGADGSDVRPDTSDPEYGDRDLDE
jgi:putative peptidoglycan lipid II flippase